MSLFSFSGAFSNFCVNVVMVAWASRRRAEFWWRFCSVDESWDFVRDNFWVSSSFDWKAEDSWEPWKLEIEIIFCTECHAE